MMFSEMHIVRLFNLFIGDINIEDVLSKEDIDYIYSLPIREVLDLGIKIKKI